MRLVLDTNVLLSGLMAPGGTPGKIVAARRGAHFDLILSDPMLEEIRRVLAYPKIHARLGWGEEEIARFLLLLRLKAEVVEIEGVAASVPRDAADDAVLATFLAGEAECLVTGDNDLLALADRYPILSPQELANRL
jgi:putative PIN family toxin of toxin-antitoxin system